MWLIAELAGVTDAADSGRIIRCPARAHVPPGVIVTAALPWRRSEESRQQPKTTPTLRFSTTWLPPDYKAPEFPEEVVIKPYTPQLMAQLC